MPGFYCCAVNFTQTKCVLGATVISFVLMIQGMFSGNLLSIFEIPDASLLYTGQYNYGLIVLSIGISVLASYAALFVARFAEQIEDRKSRLSLLTLGGITLGVGIWSMHFIGMMGFSIPTEIAYDPWITAISVLPGILAGVFSLHFISHRSKNLHTLIIGGVVLGSSIGLMHYTGMAAMRMDAALRYDPILFLVSIIVAIVLSALALRVRYGVAYMFPQLERHALLIGSIIMGGSVCCMHYTAMHAAYFQVGSGNDATSQGFDSLTLAIVVSVVVILLIGFVFIYVLDEFARRVKAVNTQLGIANKELEFQKIALDNHAIVSITDHAGVITYVNDKFCDISQYGRDELIGSFHGIINSGGHSDLSSKKLWRTIVSGKVWRGEIKGRAHDGSYYWVFTTIYPFFDKQGKPCKFVSVQTDITRIKETEVMLKEAKQAAEEASKAKSDFLANMSHEIRTPMNAILGMSRLALQTALTDKQKNYILKINSSAESLLRIINDILDFSKIEAGKLDIELVEFELEDLLEKLLVLIGDKAEAQGIELLFNIDTNIPTAFISDPYRLGQVLTNLCSNAVKFTATGGEVVVNISLIKEDAINVWLHYSVRDTGIGISSEQQARLFQPFSQGDSSTTRKYGGTGLGLIISKQLVEMLGGEIWVESKSGAGSTFHFTAKLQKQQPSQLFNYDYSELNSFKVLIVDDNQTSRETLAKLLAHLKIPPELADSGQSALNILKKASKESSFDIVLMDWKMPGLDGIETTRIIRETLGLMHIPIIIMASAYSQPGLNELTEAENLNISGIINKPVMPSAFFNTMLVATGHDAIVSNDVPNAGEEYLQSIKHLVGARILLVEDNEINMELACELLNNSGLEVECAYNGREALDMLEKNSYDGVLMDCQMPVMDGYETTVKIREHMGFTNLPIIALTANALVDDKRKALEAGMNDYITKPINANLLFATLAKWIESDKGFHDSTQRHTQQMNAGPTTDIALSSIDIEEGMSWTNHDKALYLKLLTIFRKNYSNFEQDFRCALSDSDIEAARRLAHTLKGNASTLGMERLRETSMALENVCKEKRNNVEETLVSVIAELKSVFNDLNLLQNSDNS